jgi:hypothetical protein
LTLEIAVNAVPTSRFALVAYTQLAR